MADPISRYSTVTRRAFLGGLSAAAIVGAVGCAAPSAVSTPSAASSSAASPSSTASSSASSSSGKSLPSAATATVSWTFASSTGMARNPYMAVWIEDANGNFVKTLALYHRANGDNWLQSLSNWYSSSGGTDTTTSGTVPAGSYTTTWDGTDASGSRVDQGSYYVCVESVVEHGASSLARQQFNFGKTAFNTNLTPNGDITVAAVNYRV